MRHAYVRTVRSLLSLVVVALALVAGCGDGRDAKDPLAPDARPAFAVGNVAPTFFFLPPIRPAAAYPGTFDPNRSPVVEVCAWSGTACVGAPVATFSRAAGTIEVDAADQLYRADWPTAGLTAGQLYRVRVVEGATELGFADAKIPGAGETAPGLVAQDIVPLGNSSRLPVRFRLEVPVAGNQPPVVAITAPANGAVIPPATDLTLTGTATDAQQGDVGNLIVWRSSRVVGELGTGPSITVRLPSGRQTVSASVTDAGGLTTTASVDVVVSIVTVPATLNVPFGGTASLPITLTEAAPAGGATFTVTTSDTSRVGVAAATVTVPENATSANVTLRGVAPGAATVTVSNPEFGSATAAAATTASLNIVQLNAQFPLSRTEPITIELESGGTDIAAPAGGLPVTLTSSDPTCVAVTSPVTIPEGLVSATATLSYGGSATAPCTATVTASVAGVPSVATDVVTVSVASAPITTLSFSGRVGSGLQTSGSVTLGAPAPAGGAVVTLTSADPARLLVSSSAGAAGAASASVTVPQGANTAGFTLQAIENQTGTVSVSAAATGYATGTAAVAVTPAAVDLFTLPTTATTASADVPFQVRVGALNVAGTGLAEEQTVRAGGGLTVDLTSSAPSVAVLTTSAGAAQTRTVAVPGLQSRSAAGVASGGIALDPVGAGATTVAVTAANTAFTPTPASRTVTVTGAAIVVEAGARVGSGLQITLSLSLGAPAPAGGVAVTLASEDAARLLVAPNSTTPGQPSATVTVPAGNSSASIYVQGVENQTGTVAVTATAAGFGAGAGSVAVTPAAVDLFTLPTTATTASADVPFQVRVGALTAAGNAIYQEQAVRPGGGLTVTLASSDPGVAQLTTSAGAAASRTVAIAAQNSRSPGSVAGGGVALDPVAAGTTTITVTGANTAFTPTPASRTVTVGGSAISLQTDVRVGSGLQTSLLVNLGAPAPAGGVAVTLASEDAARLLVAPNSTTPGQPSATVTVPAGNSSTSFYVQGVAGQTGAVGLTGTAAGFGGGSGSVAVTPAAFDIISLPANTTTLTPNVLFQVRVGALNVPGTGFYQEQGVRAGGPGLTFDVTNSNAAVGQLTTAAGTAQSRTVTIAAQDSRSPSSVAAGGIAFDPLGAGTTTVQATATNTASTRLTGGTQTVAVAAPAIVVNTSGVRVGGGLRAGVSVSLGAPAPAGGLPVTIASSSGAVLRLSPANNTAEPQTTTTLTVPAGSFSASFYLNGIEGQSGTVTVTASAPGFVDGTGTVVVAGVGLDVIFLPSTVSAAAANVPFAVRVGALNAAGTGFYQEQEVRVGGTPISVDVTNGNAAAAQLVTAAGAAQSRTVTIAPTQARSPGSVAAGGVAFDPLGAGTTSVSAASAATVELPGATQVVTVTGAGAGSARALVGGGARDR